MSSVMAHRGPDGNEIWVQGPISIGLTAFDSTGSGPPRPSVAREGEVVLVADVRVDNGKLLGNALGMQRGTAADLDDATLLLAAYERWGDACLERVIGDFAFAVWEANRRTLVLARDPFGIRPLYYSYRPGRIFAFASEVEALLQLPEVSSEIDDCEVARHLRIPLEGDPSLTYYRDVRRVLPAHVMTVSENGVAERRYWSPDPDRCMRLASDMEYAEALRESFVEAVRCRLRSVHPVAAMLSGGIDSAAIACSAAQSLAESDRGPLHTVSAIYPEVPESDERTFIEEVLIRNVVVPHYFEADRKSPIADIDRINQLVGGATLGANLYLNWELFGIAADAGARVVLDGFDGDTTISHGKGYMMELASSLRWIKLARTTVPYFRMQKEAPWSGTWQIARFALRRRMRRSVREPRAATRGTAVAHHFAERFANEPVPDFRQPVTEREFHLNALESNTLREAVGWIEACGSGRGVEVRFPFFDVRLVDLCLSFPPEQKIRAGWTRSVFRRAMEGILPPSIQWRATKANLGPGFRHALRLEGPGLMDSVCAAAGPEVERYLDLEELRRAYDRFLGGDNSEEGGLWRALSLALWLTSGRRPVPARTYAGNAARD